MTQERGKLFYAAPFLLTFSIKKWRDWNDPAAGSFIFRSSKEKREKRGRAFPGGPDVYLFYFIREGRGEKRKRTGGQGGKRKIGIQRFTPLPEWRRKKRVRLRLYSHLLRRGERKKKRRSYSYLREGKDWWKTNRFLYSQCLKKKDLGELHLLPTSKKREGWEPVPWHPQSSIGEGGSKIRLPSFFESPFSSFPWSTLKRGKKKKRKSGIALAHPLPFFINLGREKEKVTLSP